MRPAGLLFRMDEKQRLSTRQNGNDALNYLRDQDQRPYQNIDGSKRTAEKVALYITR